MKLDNLHQEHDGEAPYADTLVLDAGGMDVKFGGDTLAHVSFEGVDPFELAFHAMPSDWERHEEWDHSADTYNQLTTEQHCENGIYGMLEELGKIKGWVRN